MRFLALSLVLLVGCAATPARRGGSSDQLVNAYAGWTVNRADGGPTIGATYEQPWKDDLGLGGFADVTFADHTDVVVGPAVFYHPADRWTAFGGLGIEFEGGDSGLLARIGGSYEFPQKSYSISPMAFLDIGRSDVIAFLGVAFGWRF